MQKFKVSTKEFERAISHVTRYGLNELFEIVLEGELLEGGTVEKNESHDKPCCRNSGTCGCFCHNKKEEKTCICYKCLPSCLCDCHDFNRETPKELTDEDLDKSIELLVKEEVKLPEKLLPQVFRHGSAFAIESLKPTELKLNEIIDYLKAHE